MRKRADRKRNQNAYRNAIVAAAATTTRGALPRHFRANRAKPEPVTSGEITAHGPDRLAEHRLLASFVRDVIGQLADDARCGAADRSGATDPPLQRRGPVPESMDDETGGDPVAAFRGASEPALRGALRTG